MLHHVRTAFLPAVLVALAIGVTVAGCAPVTQFRRSAIAPSVTRAIQTAPVHGVAEIGGGVAVENVDTDLFPQVGDPAMYVPELEAEFYVRFRAGEFAIGAHGNVAWLDVTQATAIDMPPMDKQVVYGFGPDVSFAHRFEGTILGIGGAVGLTFSQIPWSTWELTASDPLTGRARYTLMEESVDTHLLYRVGLALHIHPIETMLIESGLMVQNHVRNIGFDDTQQSGSTISSDVHGVVPYLGVRYQDPTGLFAQAQIQFPLGFDEANVDPVAGTFTIGVAFGAPPEEEPEQELEPTPLTTPTYAPTATPVAEPAEPAPPPFQDKNPGR